MEECQIYESINMAQVIMLVYCMNDCYVLNNDIEKEMFVISLCPLKSVLMVSCKSLDKAPAHGQY